MKKATLILMLFCLGFISLAKAQQKTVVYGHLGMENVNVSISNTSVGTSSDAKGQYALSIDDRTKKIQLHFTCIGYRDTIVSLTPKQLQRDSINISFKMRRQNYNLHEVTVTDPQTLWR